jgi:hypothetical protein
VQRFQLSRSSRAGARVNSKTLFEEARLKGREEDPGGGTQKAKAPACGKKKFCRFKFEHSRARLFFFSSSHTCPALCLYLTHKKKKHARLKMQACQSITARASINSLAAAKATVKKQRVSTVVRAANYEIIATDAAPKAVGPYSQGIKVRR